MPVSKRRRKRRRRPAVDSVRATSVRRASARAASSDPLIGTAVREARSLVSIEDPLEAEVFASRLLSALDHEETQSDSAVRRLISAAERDGTLAGSALLCALAAVAAPEIAARADRSRDRMTAKGIGQPTWSAAVGHPAFSGAWVATEPFGDQDAVLAAFSYEGKRPHLLSAVVDHNLGGLIKDAAVFTDVDEVITRWRSMPEITVSAIGAADVASRLGAALAENDVFDEGPWTDDFVETRALLRARLRLLPSGEDRPRPVPMTEQDRADLAVEFLTRYPGARIAEDLSHYFIGYKCDSSDGDPTRWSPTAVELFLLDWLPRKTSPSDEEITLIPTILKSWVRFAGEKRGLPEHLVDQTLAAVDEFEAEYRSAMSDPSRFGPAKRLAAEMLTEGVDITDQHAVDQWIARFNSRGFDERDAILGEPLGSDVSPVDARRRWAIPRATGTFRGVELRWLDPEDNDDLSLLIAAEHPDLPEPSDETFEDLPFNPRLHLTLHEILANQLLADDPPEVWRTAQRLQGLRYERHEILHMLMSAMIEELSRVLDSKEPADVNRYIAALDELPESWERMREE